MCQKQQEFFINKVLIEPVIDFKKTVKLESPTLRIEFVLLLIKSSFSSVFAVGQ